MNDNDDMDGSLGVGAHGARLEGCGGAQGGQQQLGTRAARRGPHAAAGRAPAALGLQLRDVDPHLVRELPRLGSRALRLDVLQAAAQGEEECQQAGEYSHSQHFTQQHETRR